MPERDQTLATDHAAPARKAKSYREADTTMRIYLDDQKAAVSHKVDEVIASFEETPLPSRSGKASAAFNPGDTYRHTVRQSSPLGRIILIGIVLLGAGAGAYYLNARRSGDVPIVLQEPAPKPASAEAMRNEFAPPPAEDIVTPTINPPSANKPAVAPPKAPPKMPKKSTRYSENL